MSKITNNPNYVFAEHVLELTKEFTVNHNSFRQVTEHLEAQISRIRDLHNYLLARRPRDFNPEQEPDIFEKNKMDEEFEAAENFINAAISSIKNAREKAIDLAEVKMRKALDGVMEYTDTE